MDENSGDNPNKELRGNIDSINIIELSQRLRYVNFQMDPGEVNKANHEDVHSFSSLPEADRFLYDMDINKATLVEIKYNNFTRIMPNFASDYDKHIFTINKRVKDNFLPNPAMKLRGSIEIIPNGTYKRPFDCGFKANYSQLRAVDTPDYRFKYLCPLIIPDTSSFQLFMDGTLPKIAQAYGILRRPEVTLLVREPKDDIILELLSKLGIDGSRVEYISEGRYDYDVYQADYLISTCITPPLHPELWTKMRSLLGVSQELTVPIQESIILLLTRKGNKNKGRNILNSKAMEEYLHDRYPGRVEVFSGSYSLEEAIPFFGKVSVILGPHGGAFFNMNFAPSSATIIEFIPHKVGGEDPGHFSPAIVWAMAQMIGQTYWRIPCLRLDSENNMNADIVKLGRIMDSVDRQHAAR